MARILLFGMYRLGHLSLNALLSRGLDVVGMVTKPDARIEEEPLARLARSRGLPLLLPARPGDPGFLKHVKRLRPDLIVVAGYHRKFSPRLLALPPLGVLNLHGSLLPRHRGPVPWKWAILQGETVTGMTVQVMSAELDRGPILLQEKCPILPHDTGDTLVTRLCTIGGPLLGDAVPRFLAGRLEPQTQDEELATYEGYPSDEDARIPWTWDADRIRNLIRGLSPRPGAWTTCRGAKVRVRSVTAADGTVTRPPGTILRKAEQSLLVATGTGALALDQLSLDGDASILGARGLEKLGMTPGELLGLGAPSETSLPLG
jgi:methionyl-tRNA formyltransferase